MSAEVVTGPWPGETMPEPADGTHVSVPDDEHGKYGVWERNDARAVDDRRWFTGGRKFGVGWAKLAARTPRVLQPRPKTSWPPTLGEIEADTPDRDMQDHRIAHVLGLVLNDVADKGHYRTDCDCHSCRTARSACELWQAWRARHDEEYAALERQPDKIEAAP